jgi:hypothetical protein
MAYDEPLAARVRTALLREDAPSPREIRMFGGLCFTVGGHMLCGVTDGDLMVRVGPAAHGAALARPHARPMDFTGRPLEGYVFVGAAGTRRAADVAAWIRRGLAFVRTLPPKRERARRRRV